MNKRNNLFIIFLLFISFSSEAFVVLIDPGHGGSELGAMSRYWIKQKNGNRKTKNVYEKDLTLRLSKKLKRYLDPFYTTYLTRSIDRTVGLDERANMADVVKADLFISIHFNSSNEEASHGFETYYLDNHKDVAIKKVENIENKYLKGAAKTVNQILIDLVIQKTVSQSKKLANSIHENVGKSVGKKYKLKDRGVKPGLFFVLALSKRPGVLIEAGFMSNVKELSVIKKEAFLDKYARAISLGVREYLKTQPDKDLPLF
jgi:N-acetylmuramoyl-L-alanine amidase